MADNLALSLYGLSASELRELILALCMEKKVKDAARCHIDVMRGASVSTTPTAKIASSHFIPYTLPAAAAETDPFGPLHLATPPTSQRHHLPSLLTSPLDPGKVTKTPSKTSAKNKKKLQEQQQNLSPIKVKRTTLYHTCANCNKRFRQQDNGVHACCYHPGQLVSSSTLDFADDWTRTSPRTKKYSCCGRGEKAVGCQFERHVAEASD
ncbi:hypothetical protein PFICI_10218 [Pestalotiopsis fici W106-1]|uniref:C2H2-type domain-containing protein n=1 Tax=Pestalotiopsis fici (strain W106-1 / CGMCC3.15140) TaxID=1229662 RepID=W3WZ39_PESFW|nr:uncharacterized protein PFICI_10218 [Pestalotiopsis fici W106-1]ETS78156.1 hypothetical protein PFICI_10218 [Pestalotiopsis fici W106-1]